MGVISISQRDCRCRPANRDATAFQPICQEAAMKDMIAAALLASAASTASADIGVISIETLMHAQATEALLLSIAMPPEATTTLQHSFSVNTNDGAFSYQALPGQAYHGLSYSMNGLGSFDAATQTFTWSASGMLGNQTWSQAGMMQWMGDPTGPISGTAVLLGRAFSFEGTVTTDPDGQNSSANIVVTLPGGGRTRLTARDKSLGSPWTLQWRNAAQLTPAAVEWVTASSDDGIYQGTSTMVLSAVPEPSTWLLATGGALVLLMRRAGRSRAGKA
jgi:hypothetical protein